MKPKELLLNLGCDWRIVGIVMAAIVFSFVWGRDKKVATERAQQVNFVGTNGNFSVPPNPIEDLPIGTNSVQLGEMAMHDCYNSIAIGRSASVMHSNSIVIGANAESTTNNELTIRYVDGSIFRMLLKTNIELNFK